MIDWPKITSDDAYNRLAKQLRKTVASRRDRAFIATLTRWWHNYQAEPITLVEVGTKQGLFAREILLACPFVDLLIAVDRWAEYPADHPDRTQFGYARRPQASWDELEAKARKVLEPWERSKPSRCEIWDCSSLHAAAYAAEKVLPDVVFLDAGHSYEDVTNDCTEWWQAIPSGGLLCADDYHQAGHPGREKTGVSQALEDFAASCGLPYFHLHRTFYMEVP